MKKREPISIGMFPWITETVCHLATNSNPAVSCQFREEVLAERVKPEMKEAMVAWGPRQELARLQLPDGSFPVPAGAVEDAAARILATAGRLLQLHDYGFRKDSEPVKNAMAFLEDARSRDGSLPLPCHHSAFVLWVAAMHGFEKGALARGLLRFLEKRRRRDFGWLDPELEPALAAKQDSPSCPWTTLHVIFALTEFPELRSSIDVRRGALFVLGKMFKRSYQSFFEHPDHWRELDYGYEGTLCFKWAVPKVLCILGRLGCGAETKEVSDLLLFLRRTLRPNARWGAMVEGDDFLTLRILRSMLIVQQAGKPASPSV